MFSFINVITQLRVSSLPVVYVSLVMFVIICGIGTGKKNKHKYETSKKMPKCYTYLIYHLLLIKILPESIALLLCMINDEFIASSMIPVHVYSPAADSLRSSK